MLIQKIIVHLQVKNTLHYEPFSEYRRKKANNCQR